MENTQPKHKGLPGLKDAMHAKGFSYNTLARHLEVSAAHLFRVAKGDHGASLSLVNSLADTLGVTTDQLYGRTQPPVADAMRPAPTHLFS